MSTQLRGRRLIAAMCVGQVGNLLPHVALSAILAQHLMPLWHLSAGEGGLIASGYAFGYMLAVPVLTTLTDRIDARKILLVGSIVSGLATIGFGLFAQGFWSAIAIWTLAGIGFAGAYMPGLKALTDRLPPGDSSRAVTLYTSSFSFGVGFSFLVAQLAADVWDWRAAFLVTGIGPTAMMAACLGMGERHPEPRAGRLLDFAPVLRNREALGYILGYGAHCFELYGIRTWIVGFWTFVVASHAQQTILTPLVVSFVFAILAMPASILGNEAAIRFGRHRAITTFMMRYQNGRGPETLRADAIIDASGTWFSPNPPGPMALVQSAKSKRPRGSPMVCPMCSEKSGGATRASGLRSLAPATRQ